MKLIVTSKRNHSIFIGINRKVYEFSLSNDHSTSSSSSSSSSLQKVYEIDGMVSSEYSLLSIILDESEECLYAISSHKYLCSWNLSTGSVVSKKLLKKKPTGLILPRWEERKHDFAIISDKAGDIWGYNTPDFTKEVLLAGHTASIITDLLYEKELLTVISADRDEKIRLSSFPDLETIQRYCLNHTSVISSLASCKVLNHSYLLSTGWDHRLNLWDLSSQNLVYELILGSAASLKPLAVDESLEAEEVEGDQENDEDRKEEVIKEEETTKGEGIDHPAAKEEEEGGAQVEDINEEEEELHKYRESEYGNYPLKVISNEQIIAIIYKEEKKVDLFELRPSKDEQTEESSISFTSSISLPAVPIDIHFLPAANTNPSNNIVLVVLLPTPYILQFYSITPLQYINVTHSILSDSVKAALVEASDDHFNQSHYVTLLGYDGDTGKALLCVGSELIDCENVVLGMRKHELDRPFSKEETINYEAKRGSKRSRKH